MNDKKMLQLPDGSQLDPAVVLYISMNRNYAEFHLAGGKTREVRVTMAQLEKLPLETMIGASFGSLFANMDSKWLRSYERSALYGETLEIIDYSPEIDTYIKVISFPTFPGHCGCILFDIRSIRFGNTLSPTEKAMVLYLSRLAQ